MGEEGGDAPELLLSPSPGEGFCGEKSGFFGSTPGVVTTRGAGIPLPGPPVPGPHLPTGS